MPSWRKAHKLLSVAIYSTSLALLKPVSANLRHHWRPLGELRERRPSWTKTSVIAWCRLNADVKFAVTNYAIIKNVLTNYGYTNVKFRLRDYNPPILNRISAFNARVCNARDEPHLFVDKRCKWLLYNINNLKYKEGSRIVDVPTITRIKQDRELKYLEHPFDAASYLVEYYWRIKSE